MNINSLLLLVSFLLIFSSAQAQEGLAEQQPLLTHNIDVIDWKTATQRMKKLSPLGFHPFIMPLIMLHRDALDLTPEQMATFIKWRNKNRVPLLHIMDKIIYERNLFNKLALSPHTSEALLEAKQAAIFKLHERVLKYQLSCRRHILDSFTEDQWESFKFVLSEEGYEFD